MKASKAIIIVLVLAAIVAGVLFLPVRQWFMEFESYVKSLGAVGPVVVVLVYVLCTVLVHSGERHYGGRGDFVWIKDRLCRRRVGRQSRRALFVFAGAQFSARKSRGMGRGESEISLARPGDRAPGL